MRLPVLKTTTSQTDQSLHQKATELIISMALPELLVLQVQHPLSPLHHASNHT